jgi:hypothetical protein
VIDITDSNDYDDSDLDDVALVLRRWTQKTKKRASSAAEPASKKSRLEKSSSSTKSAAPPGKDDIVPHKPVVDQAVPLQADPDKVRIKLGEFAQLYNVM